MNVVIYQSLIIYIFVWIYGVHTNNVVIEGSKEGLLGENGTEIECVYTQEDIASVTFMAFNKSSLTEESIASYRPNRTPTLGLQGQYLKGRVTLAPITQLSTKAVMTFNQLMCIDDTYYKCKVNYFDSSEFLQDIISNNILSISLQVPPSKPDGFKLVYPPADSPVTTTTKDIDYSISLPSTRVTSIENSSISASKMESQNTTTAFNHSTKQTTGHDTTTSTPYPDDDFSSNASYKTTTHAIQQTSSEQVITKGDNITFVCTGDVGKPPAEHIFQKYRSGHTLSMTYTPTETSISEISENCSYYRTSNLTFQVTAEDNQAVIRCVVNSSMTDPDMFVETDPIEVYYDAQTTQSSSSCSTSCVARKEEKSKGNFDLVVGIVVSAVFVIGFLIIIWRNARKSAKDKNESKGFVDPKPITVPRTDNYDVIDLEENTNKTQTVNKAEDTNKHNEEYLKKQDEEEQKMKKSNTPPQPAVYAQVNEATKSKNKQKRETPENSDKQEEDPYAETQEGVYDETGNPRHKENKNAEQFDVSTNSSKQNSNGDNKLSIQTSQVGSYANQGFERDENRKVATVSPTVRSSSGSQNDEQTNSNRNSQSQKGDENIIGTEQTGISEEDSSHRTAL